MNKNKIKKELKKGKYNRILRNTLIAGITFIVALGVFLIALYNYELAPVSSNNAIKEIKIEGGSIEKIANTLKDNNLIKSVFFFKLYTKLNNINNLQASNYGLSENMGIKKIVSLLEEGNTYNPNQVSITFKEGVNIRKITKAIVENTDNTEEDVYNLLNNDDYINTLIEKYWFLTTDIKSTYIYYPLEGYLFPNTYFFANSSVSVEDIFTKMLDETDKQLSEYITDIDDLSLSIHEFMTLASIVELEGASANDRAAVAGVFYNRLNDGWALGSDVTTYYAEKIDDWSTSLTTNELGDCSNKYNTRCNSYIGLPIGPIGNPGLESIVATLYPDEHNNYYFVADCNGKVYLNSNSAAHNNTINKLKNENNWCA